MLKSFTENDETLNALQSALYDADPIPGLVNLISSGTYDLQVVSVFLERFGQRMSTFNLQTLLFCVLQQLGPTDKYQELRAVLVYQLAPRIDGVPGLNFSELDPLLRRFWDAAQLQPYTGSVNAVVQTLFDKARDDQTIHPAFDAMNQYLVELSPDFDLDDFMVRQSGLISRENIRDKSKRTAEKPTEKSPLKLK